MAKKRTRRNVRSGKPSARPTAKKRASKSGKLPSASRQSSVLPSARTAKPRIHNPVPRGGKKHPAPKGRAKKKNRPIKRSKSQWTVKERRSKSERSLSAKKGWLTRKFNQKIKVIEAERQREREREQRRYNEYQKDVRKQAKQAAALAKKEKVIVYREKTLREKGQQIHEHIEERIEKARTEARTEAEQKFDRNLKIVERLFQAQLEGTFDEVAYDIADEFDMEPREVYTLWAYNGASD